MTSDNDFMSALLVIKNNKDINLHICVIGNGFLNIIIIISTSTCKCNIVSTGMVNIDLFNISPTTPANDVKYILKFFLYIYIHFKVYFLYFSV